jgi:hypothetical protein
MFAWFALRLRLLSSKQNSASAQVDTFFVMNIPLGLKGEMTFDPQVAFKQVFADFYWKISCDFDDLEAMSRFIANNVMPGFARFFT